MFPPYEGDNEDDSAPVDLEPPDDDPSEADAIQLVVVIDTSTIIEIKKRESAGEQWDLFTQMFALVRQGRLVFPVHVKREVASEKFPDTPGAWCARAADVRQHPDPTDETMAEILPFVEQVVDANADAEREPADPWIAAMAWELLDRGYDVAVATDDVIDRLPLKISLRSACEALGITTWTYDTFVPWVRSTMANDAEEDLFSAG